MMAWPLHCWTLVRRQRIRKIFADLERAEHAQGVGEQLVPTVLVPLGLWKTVFNFCVTWLAYRDSSRLPGGYNSVTWDQLQNTEGRLRLGLSRADLLDAEPVPVAPHPQEPAAPVLPPEEPHAALDLARGEIRRLKARIALMKATAPVTTEVVLPPIGQTLAYRMAHEHAGDDPVEAFRAGMRYAEGFYRKALTPPR